MNTDLVDDLLAPDRLAIALRILADRAARWVSLFMAFLLFAYGAWQPEPWRIAVAVFFTVLVYLPMLVWQRKERLNG